MNDCSGQTNAKKKWIKADVIQKLWPLIAMVIHNSKQSLRLAKKETKLKNLWIEWSNEQRSFFDGFCFYSFFFSSTLINHRWPSKNKMTTIKQNDRWDMKEFRLFLIFLSLITKEIITLHLQTNDNRKVPPKHELNDLIY